MFPATKNLTVKILLGSGLGPSWDQRQCYVLRHDVIDVSGCRFSRWDDCSQSSRLHDIAAALTRQLAFLPTAGNFACFASTPADSVDWLIEEPNNCSTFRSVEVGSVCIVLIRTWECFVFVYGEYVIFFRWAAENMVVWDTFIQNYL